MESEECTGARTKPSVAARRRWPPGRRQEREGMTRAGCVENERVKTSAVRSSTMYDARGHEPRVEIRS